MIILLLCLYFFCGPTINGESIDFKTKKPLICTFNGNKVDTGNPAIPDMDPSTIPSQCELIIFTSCDISNSSEVNCPDIIKTVSGLKRPVLLDVYREYEEWVDLLESNSKKKSQKDAKIIFEYVKANGLAGVMLGGISPFDTIDQPNGTLANDVIPYIKQLKSYPNFIVGIYLNPAAYVMTDPCSFNYEAANSLVDVYVVGTYKLNEKCDANKFNGVTPTHSILDLIGLDIVVKSINMTNIQLDKVYLVVDLLVVDPTDTMYGGDASYSEICSSPKINISQWCVPTTKDYYDKAKYIHDQNYGVAVFWIEYDDINNACKCSPFIGLQNIVAGFQNKNHLPCAKFDVKAVP